MKNNFLISAIFVVFSLVCLSAKSQTEFSNALLNCDDYNQSGVIVHNNEPYTVEITLNKTRDNTCMYREKISIGQHSDTLECKFDSNQLKYLSKYMNDFSNTFKKEMSKNKIFEAKMTTNGEIFQKYLADPRYCRIIQSKN